MFVLDKPGSGGGERFKFRLEFKISEMYSNSYSKVTDDGYLRVLYGVERHRPYSANA